MNGFFLKNISHLLDGTVLEGGFHVNHFIKQDAQGPDINLVGLLELQIDFRGHVFKGSTESILHGVLSATCSKIAQKRPEILGDHDVFGLDVSMNEIVGVKIINRLGDFIEEF